jgi:hypothetical protein
MDQFHGALAVDLRRIALDQDYWREQLLAFATDANDNSVLQRNALFALEQLADPRIIEQLPLTLLDGDELIARAMLRLCAAVNSKSLTSLQYFAQGIRSREIEARHGLYAVKGREGLKGLPEKFNADEGFRHSFLDQVSIFNNQDPILVKNISAIYDDDIAVLCCEAIAQSLHTITAHLSRHSALVRGLGKLLKARGAASRTSPPAGKNWGGSPTSAWKTAWSRPSPISSPHSKVHHQPLAPQIPAPRIDPDFSPREELLKRDRLSLVHFCACCAILHNSAAALASPWPQTGSLAPS